MEVPPNSAPEQDDNAVALAAADGQRSQAQSGAKPALIGFLCSLALPCLLLVALGLIDVATSLAMSLLLVGVPALALIALVLSVSALFSERVRGVFRALAIAGLVLSTAETIGLVCVYVLLFTGGNVLS